MIFDSALRRGCPISCSISQENVILIYKMYILYQRLIFKREKLDFSQMLTDPSIIAEVGRTLSSFKTMQKKILKLVLCNDFCLLILTKQII